ncbi:MAG: head decoration protein [Methylococcaceae bacterium]|nr:MAG: head decoration protein [Methylococcaceae bacterium]
MPASFSSTPYQYQEIVAGDADDLVSRNITLLSGQNLPAGAVLGKITTTDKYTLSVAAATDGSQTPDLILAEACDAGGGDKPAIAWIGGQFIAENLTLGAGHTIAGIRDGLQDRRGILLVSSLGA